MSDLSDFERVRQLIGSKSDLNPALEGLQDIADDLGDSELKNQLVMLKHRYVSFKNYEQRGVLSSAETNNQRNQIVNSILGFTSDLEKQKQSQVSQHLQHHSAERDSELLAAAKTAVLLVEIEKFKHRYYHLNSDLREEALDELRAYQPVLTKQVRVEVYRFLYEVADDINYRSSASLGITLLSLVMHFSPGKEEECSKVLETSIAIGKKMVFASVFKAEHFKIGSNGLSIWKWAYLKAKWRDKADLMRQIETEYEELEAAIRKEEHDITNLAEKRQVIEAFKKDLTVDGMDFPEIPDKLFDFV